MFFKRLGSFFIYLAAISSADLIFGLLSMFIGNSGMLLRLT